MASEDPSADQMYKLSLDGEGIKLSQEVSKSVALAIINVALGGSPNVGSVPTATRSGVRSESGTGDTPGEYIESVGANTNVDKIIALGAYLHDSRGHEHFSRDDVKGMFRAAHESPPGNYPRDFRSALTSRAIGEDGPDRYFVTRTGRTLIEQNFAGPRGSRRGRRASGQGPKEEG